MNTSEDRHTRGPRRSLPRALARFFAVLPACAALLLIAASGAGAQDGMGRVVGRVVSGQTGEPLAAVQIFVAGTNRGTLSDAAGRYSILQVPAGPQSIVAQSLGYASKTITGVAVTAGQVTSLDISIDAQAIAVEGITVSAARELGSTTALLSDRQRAPVVSDAIGADQISRTPDGDAAAALKRVPGVSVVDGKYVYVRGLGERYGATTLNGAPMPSPLPDRKSAPLDLIPASLLESVVTAKTYLPSQPGDYAGGLVQIQTRTVPTSRMLRFSASLGYNALTTFQESLGFSGGQFDALGLSGSTRGLPAWVFSQDRVSLPAEQAARSELAQALTQRFGAPALEVPLNQSYSVSFGDELMAFERPIGVIGSFSLSDSYSVPAESVERNFVASGGAPSSDYDYRVDGASHESALGSLLSVSFEAAPAQRITATGSYNRLSDDQSRVFSGTRDGNELTESFQTRYTANSVANAQLRGDHVIAPLGNAVLNWRGSFGRAQRDEPGTRTTAYRRNAPDDPSVFLPSQSSGLVFAQQLDEDVISGAVDLKLPFTFRSLPSTLSFGASTDLRDRGVRTRRIVLDPVSGFSTEVASLAPGLLFTPERLGSAPGQFTVEDATFAADNYAAEQTILAAYAMADAELLPRLRVAGGLRVEQATQGVSVTGFREGEVSGVPDTELDDADLIPSLNLTYAVSDAMNVRAAVSRTLARPQFRELAPFLYADYFGGVPVRGNPYLERSRILNLDLRWEWFFAPDAVISAGTFYKDFTDPIEPISILLGTNPGRTFANTAAAEIFGAELEFRSSLGVLAPALESLSLNANLTLADSRVSGDVVQIYDPQSAEPLAYPVNRGATRPLFGQSPYVVNLGLAYFHEGSGASATVLYNRFGRRVDTTGGVALPDIYEEASDQLDLTMEQPLPGGLSLKLSASRLLGGGVEFTQSFPNGETVTTRGYDLGRTYSVSVGWQH